MFNLGNWLVGAGKSIGKEFDHLATGAVEVAKAAINQPVALAHELSGAVQGVSHEAGGALVGVSSALSMPLMLGGAAAFVFLMTRR
jgi:hypothetical protein